ncbi:MAG: DinB family protein [Dehalococcoidia bacterium]|nr:DinB family protein [Dehalococcoidia bacterium]
MQFLIDGFRHSGWANGALLAACIEAGPARIAAASEGMYLPLDTILRHAVKVEAVYLRLLGGEAGIDHDPETADLSALVELQAAVAAGYGALIAGLPEGGFERPVRIPWFDAGISAGDALLQVLTHSAEHRADVAYALTRAGIETPHMDYVVWAVNERGNRA